MDSPWTRERWFSGLSECLKVINARDPERLLGLPERQRPKHIQCFGQGQVPEEAGWAVVRVMGLESPGRNPVLSPSRCGEG